LGRGVPKKKVTSRELAKKLKVTPQWILSRTGIRERRYLGPRETASGISALAARQAIARAGLQAEEIDLVIGCTSSGDYVFPPMACKVQALLGAKRAGAFDVSGSSAGFTIGLGIARDRLLADASLKNIVVVGTAVQSPYIDWDNLQMAVLLGDGSAAAVVSRVPQGYGILAFDTLSHGSLFDAAYLKGGGSRYPFIQGGNPGKTKLGFIEMDGVVMGREYLKEQPLVIHRVLHKAGLKMKDVDLLIFHQANLRLMQFLMERLNLPMSKTFTNIERFGNTADASIPLALCEASEKKILKRDHVVVVSGVGAGCILGAAVMRWYA
ncbi:MAG: ketoacyl-ACP synthase III, partial [Candidatus Omnitrophica bacterium]|nr:ketoacyl-ACP synthase III [Candidatus Omnitrophota bacterium]